MITIIAGSRTITDYNLLIRAIKKSKIKITEVVSGMAEGVDMMALRFAEENKKKLTCMPADWNRHKQTAGLIRNNKMAHHSEALIAIWDGKSKGTKHMIGEAIRLGLKLYVYNTGSSNNDNN